MADKEEILSAAYGYFEVWDQTGRNEFEKLLLDDGDDEVVWIEHDPDLNPDTYRGKSDVMEHLDFVKHQPTTTRDIKIAPHGQDWRATDRMRAGAESEHRCVTDVTFKGDFIAVVHHCIDHGGGHP